MKKLFDWRNWPSWVKLLVAVGALAGCIYLFIVLNEYIQLVPQPAPDDMFGTMKAMQK